VNVQTVYDQWYGVAQEVALEFQSEGLDESFEAVKKIIVEQARFVKPSPGVISMVDI
jgi:hypothetical protein